jgi:hypothetical protein
MIDAPPCSGLVGIVTAVNAAAGTLTFLSPGPGGQSVTVATDMNTMFVVNHQTGMLSGILVGMNIRVHPTEACQEGTASFVLAWTEAPASFAQQMVTRLEQILYENVGLAVVDVDGQRVAYRDLEQTYSYWRRKLLIEKGRVSTVSRIKLDRY